VARESITVEGRPAAYLTAGQGRPVVLVHGSGGRAQLWTPQLAGRRRVEDYATWLLDLLDGLALDRVVLGGHSMGGAIAQAVALSRAERLSGLVLVGTGARLRVLPRIMELFEAGSPGGAELVGSLAYSPRTAAGSVVEAEQALQETAPAVTLGDFLACDRFDVMGALGAIRTPTLVVVGRDDRLTPPKYARFLADGIPGGRLVEIDGAGHFPQLEQPGAVNAALRGFLAELV
jgi:pimeloyl-ACP methyl ester carboxylesterase